jgi:hypothetical protein
MGALEFPNLANAAAVVVPVPAPPFTEQLVSARGVASFTRLSAGQYEIQLDEGLAFQEGVPQVLIAANQRFIPGAQVVSPGLVRVSCFDADTGAAADPDAFYFNMWAIALGEGAGLQLPLAPVPPPIPPSGGDVVGPASSVDNAIVRYDGTTGKLIQNSSVTLDDTGAIAGAASYNGLKLFGNTLDVSIGFDALTVGSGSRNTAVGANALQSHSSGDNNTAIGVLAMGNAANTSAGSVAVGYRSLANSTNAQSSVAIGVVAWRLGATPHDSIAIGARALQTNTAGDNIGIGTDAAPVVSTGTRNIAIGRQCLLNATTPTGNIVLGYQSATSIVTGDNNIVIGVGADSPNGFNENIIIGHNATSPDPGSNRMVNIGSLLYGDGTNQQVRVGGTGGLSGQPEKFHVFNGGNGELVPVCGFRTASGSHDGYAKLYVTDRDPNAHISTFAGSLAIECSGATSKLWQNTSAGVGTTWTQL